MMIKSTWKKLQDENLKGSIFLLPTDTIYGLHALVNDKIGLKKLKKIKVRKDVNFFIILISDISDIKKFDVKLSNGQKKFLERVWPGEYTVIFENKKKQKISFRLPKKTILRNFIKKVGPIYSTSANFHKEKPIESLGQAKQELREKIDFYIDEGKLKSEPSTILEIIR